MTKILDWQSNREMWIRVLQNQTGKDLPYWLTRLQSESVAQIDNEEGLRVWLAAEGVTGYAANLLVMERFGYPDWVRASADELVNAQYADRSHLRPIYDAVIAAVAPFGPFTIQTRKTYVSLLTPRRTFARIKPSTKKRIDVGLRLAGQEPGGRLRLSKLQETMKVQIELTTLEEVDQELFDWLGKAYKENC